MSDAVNNNLVDKLKSLDNEHQEKKVNDKLKENAFINFKDDLTNDEMFSSIGNILSQNNVEEEEENDFITLEDIEANLANFEKEKAEKAEKIKEQIFEEDGSFNAEKAGELFESGELGVWDFEHVFGARPNISEQVSTTLDDGTKIYCEDMRWSGMTDCAVMVITTPDGQELRFEQRDE